MNPRDPIMNSTIQLIIEASARAYSITADQLMLDTRKQHIARARQVAMYLIHTELGLSLKGTGEIFPNAAGKGKDHATVLHAIGAVEENVAITTLKGIMAQVNGLIVRYAGIPLAEIQEARAELTRTRKAYMNAEQRLYGLLHSAHNTICDYEVARDRQTGDKENDV